MFKKDINTKNLEPPNKITFKHTKPSQLKESNEIIWERYKDQIMFIENQLFHKNIRETEIELKQTFINNKSIVIIITHKKEVIGYICGDNVKNFIKPGDKDYIINLEKEKDCYIETINVHPNHQNKGYGTKLFKQFIEIAKKRKYKYISGHFCKKSMDLAFKLGGKIISTHKNYSNSDQTYYYMVMKI